MFGNIFNSDLAWNWTILFKFHFNIFLNLLKHLEAKFSNKSCSSFNLEISQLLTNTIELIAVCVKTADLTGTQSGGIRGASGFFVCLFPYAAATAATGRQRPLCASFQMNVFVVCSAASFRCVKCDERLAGKNQLNLHRDCCFSVDLHFRLTFQKRSHEVGFLALIIVMVPLSYLFIFIKSERKNTMIQVYYHFWLSQNLFSFNKTEHITEISCNLSHFLKRNGQDGYIWRSGKGRKKCQSVIFQVISEHLKTEDKGHVAESTFEIIHLHGTSWNQGATNA